VFAINHAAAALLVRRRYPDVPFLPVLLSVQAMEILWVVLNYAGVERIATEPAVRYVGDIHLAFMPYSHSLATMIAAAALAGGLAAAIGRPRLGAAVGIGILSHLVLDLATHDGDIALAPFAGGAGYGTYLYARFPAAAFLLELGFGLLCWRIYRGGAALLAIIVGFNLANLSLFFSAIPGLEGLLAGRPAWIVSVILIQIVVTLAAVWWGAQRSAQTRPAAARTWS